MSRRPAQIYRCRLLGELTHQLLKFAPPEKRIEQVGRAEKLHDEIDADVTYPYEYIAYRITGYRSESQSDTLLVGEAIAPDLRLLIDTLSRSVAIPIDAAEEVETAQQLAARLKVSTKTISRWRAAGLRWRWMQGGGAASRQLLYPRLAVERFLARNAKRVNRAGQFSQLTAGQRQTLIERARRIARRREVTLNQVATHLAKRTGRAIETMRQLLEQHDRRKPAHAIFGDHPGPLSTRQQRISARAHRMGVSIDKIAAHFGRSRSTIYRAVHQRRAAALRRLSIDFVPSPLFERDDADEILAADPESAADANPPPLKPAVRVDDLPQAVQTRYTQPPLGAMQQQLLFQRFNYLKFKAAQRRDGLDRYEPRAADLDEIEACLKEAKFIFDRLQNANRSTVLSMARRHLVGQPDRSMSRLIELLKRGDELLIDAIETFGHGPARSDFAAYLTFRLMKGFLAHTASRGSKQAGRPEST